MRIISGIARGKKLQTPENDDIRPTAESVKEAIFSAIQFELEDAVVLDLFSGTGQLGIEALSRGAKRAIFVDSAIKSVNLTKENIKTAGFEDISKVYCTQFTSFLNTTNEVFDIVILDPPYEKKMVNKALKRVNELMSENGIIICKHEKELTLDDQYGEFSIYKVYRYGQTTVTVYRRKGESQ